MLKIIYKFTPGGLMNFPGNAKCVVLLTFDFDAELMWNSYPRTPGYTQRGQYGANVGVPRILSLLENHGIKGTFFWPGANAERYPEISPDDLRMHAQIEDSALQVCPFKFGGPDLEHA